MAPNRALEAALALWQVPRLARIMRSQPLPEGLTLILQMLSGDLTARAEAQRLTTRLGESDTIAVAELYVLKVMLYRGAPPHRVLGVKPGAERSEIRRHMGWLMSWLHPDKSVSPWRAVYARRVLEAWHQIEGGIEEDQSGSPSVGTRSRRHWFLIPWISAPSEQLARNDVMHSWRKRARFWGLGLTLVLLPNVLVSDGWRPVGALGLDALNRHVAGQGSSHIPKGG
jgi:hypothetical protein